MEYDIKPLGTEYGKHYVVRELINSESIVYSGGIGEDISFDLELIKSTKCNIWGFDPTLRSKMFIENNLSDNFIFQHYGISNFDGSALFEPPSNPAHVSYKQTSTGNSEMPVKKISTIMRDFGHSHIDLLKLDIEGSEFDVIENILHEKILPKQLSVEFHKTKTETIKWLNSFDLIKTFYTVTVFADNVIEAHFLLKH